MSNPSGSDKKADYKLERYKYILQQLNALNENAHKYLALYQTLATAIIGGGVLVFVSWKQLKIDAEVARVGIRGLLGLLIILTAFVALSIISGLFSWFDYRREEVELLKKEIGSGFRQPPRLKNLWRWSETYLLLFLVAAIVFIYRFVEHQVIPLIQ
ncbi:MAG: hypothetical protein ACJ74J_13280 [Blastocatellia bacterium]